MRVTDMSGVVIGKLIVIERSGSIGGKAAWLCKCSCGQEKIIAGADIRRGEQKSCGCSQTIWAQSARVVHGKSRTALHRLWRNMINRCERPQSHNYNRYGGRGITVCQEWRNSSLSFITWCVNNGHGKGLELDRVDNDKGYSPDNCRFVTRAVNQANKSPRKQVAAEFVRAYMEAR